MGSCSRESPWGSASGLADCGEGRVTTLMVFVAPTAQHHQLPIPPPGDGSPPPGHQSHPSPSPSHAHGAQPAVQVQAMAWWPSAKQTGLFLGEGGHQEGGHQALPPSTHVPDTGRPWAGSSAQERSARTMGPTCRCSGRCHWCCSPPQPRWTPETRHSGVTLCPPCSSPIAWGWWRSPQCSPCLACWWDEQSAGGTTSPAVGRTPTACAEARSCRSPGDGGGCVSGATGARQLLFTGM